jgi:hypothetical protein
MKFSRIALAVCGAMAAGYTSAASYVYVGSWDPGSGPGWATNPPVYTAQEAAALLFGGNASDYVISSVSNDPALIDFKAWYESYGGDPDVSITYAQDFKADAGEPGYNTTGDASAYVGDGWCSGACVNYAFRISLLTLSDVAGSLRSTSAAIDSSITSSSLIVNGAHSRPLSRRVAAGQKTFWIAGDWGHDNHDYRDGTTGLAEIAVGQNFGPAQINLSAGKTWVNQDLVHNGSVEMDRQYLMVEGIFPVSESRGIYATLGAFHHWGEADVRRGYLNAGSQEYSHASPDARTWGVRARLDWENAFSAQSMRFSPYADLSYSKSKLDGYTETGGSFPARFDSREDSVTELRAGINTATPIKSSGFDFVANLEAAHRFDDRGAGSSGEVIGMFGFNLQGEKLNDNWLKAGIGVEGKLGDGKLSVMLNGTTEGGAPSSWLAASYQLTF